jgi:hypothetical protein
MRGLQASFPRIKDRFSYEEYDEHLVNFCTWYVGLNQIRSVFLLHLDYMMAMWCCIGLTQYKFFKTIS